MTTHTLVPTDSTTEVNETEWAVRWTPAAPLVLTGSKPPWTTDYARWKRSADAVVYRRTVTRLTVVSVIETDWVEDERS